MTPTTDAMSTVGTSSGIAGEAGVVLVVQEGEARLRWLGGAADWRLVGMWPDATDRQELAEHLAAGRPLLVLLDGTATVVPMWRAELGMPESAFEAVEADGDLLEVTMPFLEWLPEDIRDRGLRFWARAAAAARQTPAALQPAVMIEQPAQLDSPIRFARRSRRAKLEADELRRVADWVFSAPVPA